MLNEAIAGLSLLIWVYLVAAHGRFWLAAERDDTVPPPPAAWPAVAAVVPARNEADCVADSVGSLLRQDYPGPFTVVLVDDDSTDGTAMVAREAAAAAGQGDRLDVIGGGGLPAGWTGKLWAVKRGTERAENLPASPKYLLLTDADITHTPDSLRALVARAEAGSLVLTSLMARLRCKSLVERIHVPAFIFFFQMLYPFAKVNRPDDATAGAAGGCMLVEAAALRRAGGIAAIRDALIDDCSLAAKLKQEGPIYLGLTDRVHSIRPYETWDDVRKMIARSAYAQLRYNPLILAGTTLGMGLTYVAPPLLSVAGSGLAQAMALLAWGLMALSFQPTLRFYRMSPLWGPALPGIALLYMFYTLDSAYQYVMGRGGAWKGRAQANLSQP